VITEVKDGKVTFAPLEGKGKDAKKGDPKTMPVSDSVKVIYGKFNKDTKKMEEGDAIDGGLKNEMFSKIDAEKGVGAQITTDGGKITEIMVRKRGK
jgi:hypothetical protein